VAGTDRYIEIDAARGVAILMMILFHTVFDLSLFHVYPVTVVTGFWRYFAFFTASLFLFIVGVSLVISHAREEERLAGDPRRQTGIAVKFLKRGVGIFACGLLVTFATWLYLGEGFVIFGILHLIGVSTILALFFFRFRKVNLLIGCMLIVIGILLAEAGVTGPFWLLWLGIPPAPFTSVDYTPLLPWFGVVLVGMGVGERLYPGGKRSFAVPRLPALIFSPLAFLGRHSLLIYLLHQPVILILLQLGAGVPTLA
jgi:uncharacterized membrane protein